MSVTLQSVIMALALLVASTLTILIEKLRKENKRDHGYVRERLDDINENVKEVNNRLDKHIDWHMGEPVRPARKRTPKRPAS
jgi:hypothetical protein